MTKKSKQKKTIIGVTIGIIFLVFIVGGIWLTAGKDTQTSIGDDSDTLMPLSSEEEKQYIEFEKLFRVYQDDMQGSVDELLNALGGKEYAIYFDEGQYESHISVTHPENSHLAKQIDILYDNQTFVLEENEETAKILNENKDLIDALEVIDEGEVITSIVQADSCYVDGHIVSIVFYIDAKATPFVTSNNGVQNAFVYCKNENCEKYGYKNIEGNWYMWISPAPE